MPVPEAESLPVLDASHSIPARRYLSRRAHSGGRHLGHARRGRARPDRRKPPGVGLGRGHRPGDQAAGGRVVPGGVELGVRQPAGGRSWPRRPASDGLTRRVCSWPPSTWLITSSDAPAWIFPVLRHAADAHSPRLGSSIYGAVQQLILGRPGLWRRHDVDHAVLRPRGRGAGTARPARGRADHGAAAAGLSRPRTLGPAETPSRGRSGTHWNRWQTYLAPPLKKKPLGKKKKIWGGGGGGGKKKSQARRDSLRRS